MVGCVYLRIKLSVVENLCW